MQSVFLSCFRMVFLFWFLLPGNVAGQDGAELIRRMRLLYSDAEKLEYKSHYALYNGYTGDELLRAYDGYFYRSPDCTYQKIGSEEYIFGKDFYLEIHHEERGASLYNARMATQEQIDLSGALAACEVPAVEDAGDHYIVRLTFKKNSQIMINAIHLTLSKKDCHLKQMDIFYPSLGDVDGTDVQFPRLRITFTDFTLKPKDQAAKYRLTEYTEADSGTLKMKGLYSGYILEDNRLKK